MAGLAVGLASASLPARADLCRWIDGTPAQMAADLLKENRDVRLFCATCGDRRAVPFRLAKASAIRGDATGKRLRLTDTAGKTRVVPVDSVYIPSGRKGGPHDERLFTNVADLATCFTGGRKREIASSGPLPFEESTARGVIGGVSLRECATTSQPPVDVTVTFAPTGVVRRIDVPSDLAGTPVATCIDARLQHVQIAAFSGSADMAVTQSFTVGPVSF